MWNINVREEEAELTGSSEGPLDICDQKMKVK